MDAAYDAFVASFVTAGELSERTADAMTDEVASASDGNRASVMSAQLERLLRPGTHIVIAGLVKSVELNGRAATALYAPKKKREAGRLFLMLHAAAPDESVRSMAFENMRPASQSTPDPGVPWREFSMYAAAEAGDAAAVADLIQRGADANAGYLGSDAPLLRALQHRNEEVAAVLLQAGADVAHATEDGCTPLIMCAEPVPEQQSDAAGARLATRLLASGAGATLEHRDCNGCTALGAACLRGNPDVAEVLAAAGAEVDAADKDGITPLMLCFCGDAKGRTQTRLVTLMLDGGASVDAVDCEGHDALFFCRGAGRIDLLRTLQEHAADEEDEQWGEDGMPADADAVERLMTTMMMQRDAENRRLGRHESEEDVARAVATSPHFLAALEGRGELRGDHASFSNAYFGGPP